MNIDFGKKGRFASFLQPVGAFEIVPEGKHNAEIFYADERKTKAGEDMLVLGLKTEWGTVFHNLVVPGPKRHGEVVEFMLFKFSETLKMLGLKNTGKVSVTASDLLTKAIGIKVKHVEYDGQLKAKVEWFFDLKDARAKTCPEKECEEKQLTANVDDEGLPF